MTTSPGTPELDAAACQRALAILVDVGTSLAQECKTPTPENTLELRTKSFDRAALAVRRSILLSQHIAQGLPVPGRAEADAAARAKQRRQVLRGVEDNIGRHADPADIPALRLELLERIDSPDFDEDLASRSPEELIAEITRDLALANLPGVQPRHCRRTPEDVEILFAQAAAPTGAGLPRWCVKPDPPDPPPDPKH